MRTEVRDGDYTSDRWKETVIKASRLRKFVISLLLELGGIVERQAGDGRFK